MSELDCPLCGKTFAKANSLSKHKRRSHPEKPREKFGCFHCEYQTVYKYNLHKHMKRVHFDEDGVLIEKRLCSMPTKACNLCNAFKCTDRNKMIDHYIYVHDVPINSQTLHFKSFDEFLIWKREIESQDHCRFVAVTSSKKRLRKQVWFFRCFRDGHYMPRGKGQRSLKVKGSVKIGSVCPCGMKVTKTLETGAVTVLYATPHVGHKPDVGRLNLTKEDREYIASKISAGVSDDELLSSLRDSVSDAEFSRLHLTTRKDLWNIKNSARIQKKSETDEHTNYEGLKQIEIDEGSQYEEMEQIERDERTNYEEMKRILITNITSLIDSTENCAQLEVIRKAFLPLPEAIKAVESGLPSSTSTNFSGNHETSTKITQKNPKTGRQKMKLAKQKDQPVVQEEHLASYVLSEVVVGQPIYIQSNGENEFTDFCE